MKKSFQTWQLVIAVIAVCIFPLGLLVLLIPRKWKCTVCGRWLEQNNANTENKATPLETNQSNSTPVKQLTNKSTNLR